MENGVNGKIILTELMRMATALGIKTVCEGVETAEHVDFLSDIGCCKLQGYYFTKPIPLEKVIPKYKDKNHNYFENPDEYEYYNTLGKINLYDVLREAKLIKYSDNLQYATKSSEHAVLDIPSAINLKGAIVGKSSSATGGLDQWDSVDSEITDDNGDPIEF
jgi:c-di-GMP-related signal transduction protein